MLAASIAALVFWRAEGSPPDVEGPDEALLGVEPREVALNLADEGSGLREVRATLVHARGESLLAEEVFPGNLFVGGEIRKKEILLRIDPEALDLRDGEARIRIAVRDWSWADGLRGNETLRELPATIDLRAPSITIESGLTYVGRAGAAAVRYRVDEPTTLDGVEVDESFFPGFPWPRGGAGCEPERLTASEGAAESPCRLAIFAVPVLAGEDPSIRVVAEDRAGNRASEGWAVRVKERSFPEVPIRLSPAFLSGKVPVLARELGVDSSDPLAAFQEINTTVRAQNERKIRELLEGDIPEPIWSGAFEQLPNSKVTSRFAERRRYVVEGKTVSRATHYGFDLASTELTPIMASNAGRVIFAGKLGIYGNCVLLDHGLGVASLYGHLSRIDVSVGDAVRKGQSLGRSGQTGLAGGDHLHFAILVGGTYVDPVEWWDPKWVREHIEVRMAGP